MKYTIQKTGGAAYLQLYKQLRADIVEGIYPFGSKLPSKRTVAEETGVSVVTVEHAYALLCDEGYVESRERSGYYVTFRVGDGFAAGASTLPPAPTVPHLDVNSEFPISVFLKTARSVMSEYGEGVLERSPNEGREELREAIRRYLARSRGITAETEQIVIGAGAEYLYGLIVQLLGRDKVFGIESPSYKKIEQVYRAAEVTCELLPLSGDGIESGALWASGADVLHISPYRSFPSGITATASKRHEYIRWSARAGRYIVEDDFESEFSLSQKSEETVFSHTPHDNVIYMNTFSKTVSSSLRVGYMVLPHHLLSVFQERLGFYSCTVPTFVQLLLAGLINGGDFERHINRERRKKRKEMQNG